MARTPITTVIKNVANGTITTLIITTPIIITLIGTTNTIITSIITTSTIFTTATIPTIITNIHSGIVHQAVQAVQAVRPDDMTNFRPGKPGFFFVIG